MGSKKTNRRIFHDSPPKENPQKCGLIDNFIMADPSMLYADATTLEISADALLDGLSWMDIPETATLDDCREAFESLDIYAHELRIFDKCRGETAWLQGAILNLVKPIEPGQKGIAKRGEWKPFIESIGVSDDDSERFRHINRRFTRNESRQLGYTEMIGIYVAERQLEKGNGKGKTQPKPKSPIITTGNIAKSITGSVDKLTEQAETIGKPGGLSVTDNVDAIQKIATEIDSAIVGLFKSLYRIYQNSVTNPELRNHLRQVFDRQLQILREQLTIEKAALTLVCDDCGEIENYAFPEAFECRRVHDWSIGGPRTLCPECLDAWIDQHYQEEVVVDEEEEDEKEEAA